MIGPHFSNPPVWPVSTKRVSSSENFVMEEGGQIKKTLYYSLCIICQTESEEDLVKNPISHKTVLNFIEERVKYGDWQYSEAWKSLSGISSDQLAASKASWHRKCYQDVAHTEKLKRIKER